MFKTLQLVNDGETRSFSHKSNSLSCDKSGVQSTFSLENECPIHEEGDPYDILGEGLYASDINCYHKMRVGWISDKNYAIMEIPPSSESPDFKPSDA